MKTLQKWLTHIAVIFTAATAFLLPVKFGAIAGVPELPGFYPGGVFEWLIAVWPVTVFPLFAGVALLLTLAGGASRLPAGAGTRVFLWLWGAIVPVAALWASLNTTIADYGFSFAVYYLSIGAWCWSTALLIGSDSRCVKLFSVSLVCGALAAIFYGWYQYFWGFEETRRFFAEAAASGKVAVGEQLQIKLNDDRVYSTFSSCNSFAGFLVLTIALLFYFSCRAGEFFEPRRLSRILFGGGALLVSLLLLPLTRSRGALLVFALTLSAALFSGKFSRKLKIAVLAAMLFAVCTGAWYVHRAGRGFSSGVERVDYLITTTKLLAQHPFSGTGWDGFYHNHMRMKQSATDEAAHDPHNFVASFAAAGGVVSGIAAFAALFLPLWIWWFKRRKQADFLHLAFGWGCVAFALHMLMEVDYLVPGALGAFVLLGICTLSDNETASEMKRYSFWKIIPLLLAVSVLWGGVRWLKSDVDYASFVSLVEPEPGTAWKIPSPDAVEKRLEQLERSRPNSPFVTEKAAVYYLEFARNGYGYNKGACISRAEELLRRSLSVIESPGFYVKLARAAEMRGDFEESLRCKKAANRLFPAKYKLR